VTTTEASSEAQRSPALPSGGTRVVAWTRPDARRVMQLVLATIWLLDGILQLQSFFFTKSFGFQMISGVSSGNPSIVARPIAWSAAAIGHHAVLTDAVFALIQLAIGFAIAWRPAVKWGLAGSIVWSIGVWWIGEGLGGVLNGTADPVNGAPGAVILYALLAVLLWPTDRLGERRAPFVAARSVGATPAKVLWALLWGSLAYFAVLGPNRSSHHLHDLIGAEAVGEPRWVATMDGHIASAIDHHALLASTILAVLLLIVAIGAFVPTGIANATLVLAVLLGLVIWVVGENFGALFTNGATDVNSGPLLILLAASYWRFSTPSKPLGVSDPTLNAEGA
jgi:hypothetical protein